MKNDNKRPPSKPKPPTPLFLPKAYFNLIDACKFVKSRVPNITPEHILHYAGMKDIILMTYVPKSVSAIGIHNPNYSRAFKYPPKVKPDMLVLSSADCIAIELEGSTEQSIFPHGFTYFKGRLHNANEIGNDWSWQTSKHPISISPKSTQEESSKNSGDDLIPKPILLTKNNTLISYDNLQLLIKEIEDNHNTHVKNKQQNQVEEVNNNTPPELNSPPESVPTASPNAILPESTELKIDNPEIQSQEQPVIGRIYKEQIEINKRRVNSPYRPRSTHTKIRYLPSLKNSLSPNQANKLNLESPLIKDKYLTLVNAATLAQCTENELLERCKKDHLIFITPVPNGIYLHPVDESKNNWLINPQQVPEFLVLDKLDCNEAISITPYMKQDFSCGFDLASGKMIQAYINESTEEAPCVWRVFLTPYNDGKISITPDRIFVTCHNPPRLREFITSGEILNELSDDSLMAKKSDEKNINNDTNPQELITIENQHHNIKNASELSTKKIAFLLRTEVMARLQIGRTKMYDYMNPNSPYYDEKFPLPIVDGARKKRWVESDIQAYQEKLLNNHNNKT